MLKIKIAVRPGCGQEEAICEDIAMVLEAFGVSRFTEVKDLKEDSELAAIVGSVITIALCTPETEKPRVIKELKSYQRTHNDVRLLDVSAVAEEVIEPEKITGSGKEKDTQMRLF